MFDVCCVLSNDQVGDIVSYAEFEKRTAFRVDLNVENKRMIEK